MRYIVRIIHNGTTVFLVRAAEDRVAFWIEFALKEHRANMAMGAQLTIEVAE